MHHDAPQWCSDGFAKGGTKMSEQEAAFRVALRDLVYAMSDAMPPALQADILDHLTRTDSERLTLCFASPLRERLVGDVLAWLAHARPTVHLAFEYALHISRRDE
jgi:hypothetical protein